MDSKEMKDQAQYIWSRLDDLAKTDPDAYNKFIEKQMEERKAFTSSPEPQICLQTTTTDGKPQDIFINICGWKRIPYPESDEEPIKLFAGKKTTKKNKSGAIENIIPVALNDKMYEECTETELNKNKLFDMILDLIQDTSKIEVSRNYKKYKEIYKGDLPADPRTLFMTKSQIPNDGNIMNMAENMSTVNSPEELLKRLSTNDENENKVDSATNVDAKFEMDSLLGKTKENNGKKVNLIEEINSNGSSDSDKISTPEHTIVKMSANKKHPTRYVMKIQLPLVSGVSECDLNITENSVELTVEGKYYLATTLPILVSEDDATARFNKKTSCLTLNLPLQ